MATATKIDTTDIVTIVEANPVMVLTDREKFNQFYEAMKRETDSLEIDLTTEKGRAAIKSMAFKVAQTKTAIDKAGKLLNEDARLKINAVDKARREIWDQLEALQKEVRAPLTEWEAAEEKRIDDCKQLIERLKAGAIVSPSDSAADIAAVIARIRAEPIDDDLFRELATTAELVRGQTLLALRAELERAKVAEAERAELEKLRAEAAEREARESAEREERERAERERAAAEETERQRVAAQEAEADRIRQAEERAAQTARDDETRKAREAEEARNAEHQAQLAEERRQREEAERIAREEQSRRAAEEAEAARQAEEDRKREANRAHRSRVQKAAKEAIMACGTDEATARDIVVAIVAGRVPAVTLTF